MVNFLIHLVNGILLYWFLMLTFNLPYLKEKYSAISYRVALFASLIFISHPIQTQSVTYIVQRMASMAGMFYLLSMVFYIQGRLSSGKVRTIYFLSYLMPSSVAIVISILTRIWMTLIEIGLIGMIYLASKFEKGFGE